MRSDTGRLAVTARCGGALLAIGSAVVLAGVTAGGSTGASAATGVAGLRAAAAAPSAGNSSTGHWGQAKQQPGTAALSPNLGASPHAVSCAAVGYCATGGMYLKDASDDGGAYVADERHGTWGAAAKLPLTQAIATQTSTEVDAISCFAAGQCDAVGTYSNDGFRTFHVLATRERDGQWSAAVPVPPAVAGITSISISNNVTGTIQMACASLGNCAMAGNATDAQGNEQVMVADERGGTWGAFRPVPGFDALGATNSRKEVLSISCPPGTSGDCAIAGIYNDAGNVGHGFTAEESNGTWGAARQVPGVPNTLEISCATAGGCVVAGNKFVNASLDTYIAEESGGVWGDLFILPGVADLNAGGIANAFALTCPSDGNCVAAGTYVDGNRHTQVYVAEKSNGTWGNAAQVPGLGDLNQGGTAQFNGITCPLAGSCVVAGTYQDAGGNFVPFYTQERSSAWGQATQIPGISALAHGSADPMAVSCFSADNCAIVGFYNDGTNPQAFVADESTVTSTSLTLSPAKITFGHEQSEHITVAVKPATSGTPSGTVTVKAGNTTLCAITVAASTGGCTLPASELHAGTYQLTATYKSDTDYSPSTSSAKTLTVTKAATSTAFTLSAVTVKAGHERTERITVTVKPATSGTPAGTVVIKAGSAGICTITLHGAKGSCTLSASKLRPGAYQVTASYHGANDYSPSSSTAKKLTVTK